MKNLSLDRSRSIQKRETLPVPYKPEFPTFSKPEKREIDVRLYLLIVFLALICGGLITTISELRPDRVWVMIPFILSILLGIKKAGII